MRRRGLRLVAQRENWDCGVAAMATLFSKPYEEVWAASHLIPDAVRLRRGLGVKDMELLAREFGRPLERVYRSKGYLLNQTGILGLLGSKLHWAGHWVVIQNNNIIEPDGAGGIPESWPVLDYLAAFDARPCTLLVEPS